MVSGLAPVPAIHRPAPAGVGHRLPRYGVFVFSNLCRERESGDTGGMRVIIARFRDGDSLSAELTDGALMAPQQAEAVRIAPDGRLSAELPDRELPGPDPRAHMRGRLGKDALLLRDPSAGSAVMRLPRVRDFAQPLPACRQTSPHP